MQSHRHNVYVTEAVDKVIDLLRKNGVEVDFSPNKGGDPAYTNGYIGQEGAPRDAVISNCDRWRKNEDPKQVSSVPKGAMTCLQFLSSAARFASLCAIVESNFHVVEDCRFCTER